MGIVESPSSSTTTNVLYLTPPTPPYNPNYGTLPAGGLRLALPGGLKQGWRAEKSRASLALGLD